MKVSFKLYSSFLQTQFPETRAVLVGQRQAILPPALTLNQPLRPYISAQPAELVAIPTAQISPTDQIVPEPRTQPATRDFRFPQVKVTPSSIFSTRLLQSALTIIASLAVLTLLVIVTPDLYYRVFPAETVPVQTTEEGTPLGGAFNQANQESETEPTPTPKPLPPQDPTLPEGTWLIIPRIGVRTQPLLTEDEAEALKDGVWMVPDYGTPEDTTLPIILAAHRYGWQWWWKTDYWKYHSFYLLPETQPGDLVEIIHDQRKYTYEIYAGEEGEEITDYSAEMILYTCKFLNSPLRHFRYARLIDATKNTQAS